MSKSILDSKAKILVLWGSFDVVHILWRVQVSIEAGKVPYYSDYASVLDTLTTHGGEYAYAFVLVGALLEASVFVSAGMLLARHRRAVLICWVQMPFRLLLSFPSISVIPILLGFFDELQHRGGLRVGCVVRVRQGLHSLESFKSVSEIGKGLKKAHADALEEDIEDPDNTPGVLSVDQIDRHCRCFKAERLPRSAYGGYGASGFLSCPRCDPDSESVGHDGGAVEGGVDAGAGRPGAGDHLDGPGPRDLGAAVERVR